MSTFSILLIVPTIIFIALLIYAIKSKNIVGTALSSTVVIVVVAVLLVPTISDVEPNPTNTTLQFDDFFVTDAESASGSLELLTIDGGVYAHAKDLGRGTLTYSDRIENYDVSKAKLDIFMIAGQSNAAYRPYGCSDTATSSPNPSMGTAYYFGAETGPVSKPYEDLGIEDYDIWPAIGSDGVLKLAHLEGPFSKTYYDNTHHKVLTVNCAIGGTSLITWMPGGSSFVWAQELFNAAISKIDRNHFEPSVKSCIWIQGEADYGQSIEYYEDHFVMMMDSFFGTSAFNFNRDYSFDKILISQTRVTNWEGTPSQTNAINPALAQQNLAREYSRVILATSIADTFTIANGLMIYDDLHYSQLGQNLLGLAFANAISG